MKNSSRSFYSFLSIAWLILIIGLAGYNFNSLVALKKTQFDIMALLPEGKTENMKEARQFMDDARVANHVLIVLGHQDPAISKTAYEALREEVLRTSIPIKEQSHESLAQDYTKLFQHLHPFRAGFLAAKDRQNLLEEKGIVLINRAMAEIMTPFGTLGPVKLKTDPFFLYPAYATSFLPNIDFEKDSQGDSFIQYQDKSWYIFKANLTDSGFSIETQTQLSEKLLPYLEKLQTEYGVEVLKTGAVFYAESGSRQARDEISFIGFLSFIAIVLMLLFIFRTLRPMALAISVITTGIIGGLAGCLLIFGSVHIISLVFGCSLVGITVDYALHFYCASCSISTSSQNRFQVLKSLMPALPLGVLSSTLGYGMLAFTPFPGIQQMAVLASIGLLCAFISVCLWGPLFVINSKSQSLTLANKIQSYLSQMASLGNNINLKNILSILLLALFCAGGLFIHFEDDVRSFQSLDPILKKEESAIKSMLKIDTSSKFLSIEGSSIEEVLQTEEQLMQELDLIKSKNQISRYRSLASLIPSKKQQQQNRELVTQQLYDKYGNAFVTSMELENSFDKVSVGLTAPYFSPEASFIDSLPEGWAELIHISKDGSVTGRIQLSDVEQVQAIKNLSLKYAGVRYIDPLKEYSDLFASYRQLILMMLAAIIILISTVLTFWKGFKSSTEVVKPVFLSILASVGFIALFQSFNLFHAMGMLLVLCIGIDYALFLYWKKEPTAEKSGGHFLLLANGLAALTTIFSFGLLYLSKTAAVSSFGLSVFVGITLSFFVTTIFLGKR